MKHLITIYHIFFYLLCIFLAICLGDYILLFPVFLIDRFLGELTFLGDLPKAEGVILIWVILFILFSLYWYTTPQKKQR